MCQRELSSQEKSCIKTPTGIYATLYNFCNRRAVTIQTNTVVACVLGSKQANKYTMHASLARHIALNVQCVQACMYVRGASDFKGDNKLRVPTTQLAKMSIDLKFVELTADVLEN